MRVGDVVAGKYRLRRVLGTGGMGEVWSAVHAATDREFAIKFLHARVASPEGRARFSREAKASARINHPNIIDVFDVGEMDDGSLYLVMELLDGMPLSDALYAVPPLTVQDFLSIMLDSARALVAAHGAGIVHRDIKPANIFLHRDRSTGLAYAKLLDFGISKFSANEDSIATKTGSILGSPRYMSPEQARSAADADQRADLWAMGVILFEGLTGLWPHDGDSFSSLVIAIATTPPREIDTLVPELPYELRAIVRDCLRPLQERLSSAQDLAARLERVLEDPTLASIPLPRPRAAPGSETKASTSGLRVRPATLTSGNLIASTSRSHPRPNAYTEPLPNFPSSPGYGYSGTSTTGRHAAIAAPIAPTDSISGIPSFGGIEEEETNTTRRMSLQKVAGQAAPAAAPPARADGLTESVSAMNLETVVMPGLDARPTGVPPLAAPQIAPPAPPPPSSSKLGLVAAALAVLAVGLGIAIVATLRTANTPAAAPPVADAPTASAAPSAAPAAPPETSAAPTAEASAAAATPPPEPASAAPSASAAAAAAEHTEPHATKHVVTHPAAPAQPKKPRIDALGSGL